MKKLSIVLGLAVSCLLLPLTSVAQYVDWTGAVSTEWNEPANWNPATVPNSTSFVRITQAASGGRYPVLSSSVKVGYFRLQTYQITIGSHTLEADEMDTTGGTIVSDNGRLKVTGINPLYGTYIQGPINIDLEYGRLFGITYGGDVVMHITSKTNQHTWWPRNSGVYISYNANDTFKGNVKFIVDGVGDLNIGTYAFTTLFEKKVDFILSNPGPNQTRVYFSQRGGTSIFKDSVNIFLTPRTEFYPKSFVNFEGVVSINNQAGIFKVMQYDDFTNNPFGDAKSSLVHFRRDININQAEGSVAFGSDYTSEYQGFLSASSSGSLIDTLATAKLNGAGLAKGSISFINTTINTPHTELAAVTHPAAAVEGTGLSLANCTVNGSISLKADNIKAERTTFNGRAVLNKDGYSAAPNSAGGNTFNKPLELVNSAGYDWVFGTQYPDTYRDSVRIVLAGAGERQVAGNPQGAFFKLAMVNGNRFEGPVRIESGADSNHVHIGASGGAEFLDRVDISEFKSGDLIFSHSRFNDTWPSRTLVSAQPKMRLLLKDNCYFEGPVTIKVPRFGSNYTTFMKPAVIWKTENGDDGSIGGNTFRQRVQFKNTASSGNVHLLSGEDKLIDRVPQ